jgi:hypothetical protein
MTKPRQTRRQAHAMTEDDLLTGLLECMILTGWRCQHVRRSDRALIMGNPGLPDILALPPHGGPLLAIECKTQVGVVSDEQAAWLVGLAQAGVTPAVVRPEQYDRAVALIIRAVSDREAWAWSWRAR